MNWQKRKKRNRILRHHGFKTWKQYQDFLRRCSDFRFFVYDWTVTHVNRRGWGLHVDLAQRPDVTVQHKMNADGDITSFSVVAEQRGE